MRDPPRRSGDDSTGGASAEASGRTPGASGGGQTAAFAASGGGVRSTAASPLNHSREGESHSSPMATATIDDMKPPATIPVTKSGTASTESPTRAARWPSRA